jgi:enoyl-CoA hydratase/carnithine racemase
MLLGERFSAERAREVGLVNRVVEPDALDAAVAALAERITSKLPAALAIGKEAFYRQVEMPLDEAYRYTAEVMTTNMMLRDTEAGIDAFIAKQPMPWAKR